MGNCTDGNPTTGHLHLVHFHDLSLPPQLTQTALPTFACRCYCWVILIWISIMNFFFFLKKREFFKINCDKIFIKIYFSQLLFFLTSFYFLPLIHRRSSQWMNPYTTDLYTRYTNATLSGVCTSLLSCHILGERFSHYCSSSALSKNRGRATTTRHRIEPWCHKHHLHGWTAS